MAPPPPGPRGEAWGERNHTRWRADMFGFLKWLTERHGDVVGFDLGHSPHILVNGATQVRELFLERWDSLRKPEFVKDSNRGHWGDGLTTLEGAEWQDRRPLLRRSFLARHVEARLPVIAECTREMLDAWTPGTDIDLARELRVLTARIAVRVVLDGEVQGYGSGQGRSGLVPFDEAFGEQFESLAGGDPTAPLVMVRPRAPADMDTTVRIIDERIATGEDRGDVLSQLVLARTEQGRPLGRDQIVGEIIQMLYAGHHTIPSSLLAFWDDLAAHTDVAARVAAEAERLCERGDPSPAALSDSFCMLALKESMRVHPPAPLLYREVERPFELDGYLFERDVAVWVCPQLLHHDPRYFPAPERFRPERFVRGSGVASAEHVYLPFGAGPRTCVGNHLALQQMTLVGVLTALRFEPRADARGPVSFYRR